MHFSSTAEYYACVDAHFGLGGPGVGLDFSRTGSLRSREVAAVALEEPVVLPPSHFSPLFPQAALFIEEILLAKRLLHSANWLRVNYDDDALNSWVGIGSLSFRQNWQLFILASLSTTRAAEAGDTAMVLFDSYFDWAVHLELSQQDATLAVEVYQRDYPAAVAQ
ncbi:hypothetical protein [Hymenobacter edaphi]|uniref:Uncharacterized protein n=1 Tax=Hymenobacter edaphi TaxID=2211146 RepID=A0A328BFI5_9BACT|nr:hypothetical protein [Hymenobacter edaphi]RAK65853.1 hypothetical protein DLM85_14135 [Hymenobacter edaphi]